MPYASNNGQKIFLYLVVFFVFIGTSFYLINKNKKTNNQIIPATVDNVLTENFKEETLIVAFGDSLTAGYGVSLEESYPALLEKDLLKRNKNIRIINMGVSGETTTGSLDRVDFVISQKPSLVLLSIGANDMLRASSPKITKENLRTILDSFQKEGIDVLLLGMRSTASNGEIYRREFDAIYPSLAKEYNLPLVPFFLDGVALNPNFNTGDGIHPNKAGYEKIIKENILPVLLPLLNEK